MAKRIPSGSQADIDDSHWRLMNFELANQAVSVNIAANSSAYQQWIGQACRDGRLSNKLIDDFKLVVHPSSLAGCQQVLKGPLGYQGIKLLLQQ
ncbi:MULTISPECIES: hypothetical protein [Pseudomonadati]|uniref:Uncharacterized protein n=1 Tax=Shewanella aestuarii TaxID=1028752 RepID=A0ABT0L2R9_9GAMM|nr:hypothetical protein [Shewanella aestuarii]MCL1117983.1 hypothetical protein [Shewanella aestuarii]GGN79318.1 hypothetical protein GCM10009193_23130 [Shewanella aestuarii]